MRNGCAECGNAIRAKGLCGKHLYAAFPEFREQQKAWARNWKTENKAKVVSARVTYRAANLTKLKAAKAAWAAKNPIAIRVHSSTHRARAMAGGRYSVSDVRELYVQQKGLCVYCAVALGDSYHIDHIQPLALDGANDKTNLQLLCQPCNQSKWAKDPIEYARQVGRLC